MQACFLLKETGTLNDDEGMVRFWGRNFERGGDTIFIFEDKAYYMNLLRAFEMKTCREVPAPPAPSTTSTRQVVSVHFTVALKPSTTHPEDFGQETHLRMSVDAKWVGCPYHIRRMAASL